MRITAKRIILLIVCLLGPLGVGLLSSLLSGDMRAAYEALPKPPLAPPGWLFGVVWPILYVLMGVGLYLALTAAARRGQKAGIAAAFCLQLALNFAWSLVFFRAGALWPAAAVILALDIAVVVCITLFTRASKLAGLLMWPYMLWLFFATYLSVAYAFGF